MIRFIGIFYVELFVNNFRFWKFRFIGIWDDVWGILNDYGFGCM